MFVPDKFCKILFLQQGLVILGQGTPGVVATQSFQGFGAPQNFAMPAQAFPVSSNNFQQTQQQKSAGGGGDLSDLFM